MQGAGREAYADADKVGQGESDQQLLEYMAVAYKLRHSRVSVWLADSGAGLDAVSAEEV